MSKVTLRGTIESVSEERQAGTSKVKEVVIHRTFHDPDTGEKKGEDFFPVQVFEKCFDSLESVITSTGKIEMQGFVNGRKTEKDGKPSYFCNIVAKSFSRIN